MGRTLAFLLTTFLWQTGQALDIDEKLTLRLLKLSKTRKTVLINRGVEDGLAVGDHAKFYLTTGMIARGVVVKTSPARSVWSLYRTIDPNHLVKDKVVNLKIATPVKVTPDPTKMVMVEPIAKPGEDIPIAQDAQSLELAALAQEASMEGDGNDKQAAAELGDQIVLANTVAAQGGLGRSKGSSSRSWELTFHGHFNGLGQSIENDTQKVDSESQASYDLGVGVEKYFPSPGVWYEKLSLHGLLHFGQNDALGLEGTSLANSFWGVEGGLNYHFRNSPRDLHRPIVYGTFGTGFGYSEDRTALGTDETSKSLNGNISFYHAGLGIKYYTGRWGGKAQVDYYQRTESYITEEDDGEKEEIRTLTGPRLLLGLLYRL